MNIFSIIQTQIGEASEACQLATQALEITLPEKIQQSHQAIEKAEEVILTDLIQLCSKSGQSEKSRTAKYCQEIVKHRVLLEQLPKVEPVLKQRREAAITKTNHARALMSRAQYDELFTQLVDSPRAVDYDLKQKLVSCAAPHKAAEAHRLIEALNDHMRRLKRTGEYLVFTFEREGELDGIDRELARLRSAQ